MTIELNGSPREVPAGSTLDALIAAVAGSLRGSAAAVDGEVVPRAEWQSFELADGQHVEIITAVQGG
jgi:sulfur carrier protein